MEINKPGWETKWANGEAEFKTNHHIFFLLRGYLFRCLSMFVIVCYWKINVNLCND